LGIYKKKEDGGVKYYRAGKENFTDHGSVNRLTKESVYRCNRENHSQPQNL